MATYPVVVPIDWLTREVRDIVYAKPAPTEQVQRAAYSIRGACADILQAVQDVTDPHAAYEIWQMVENAWRAVDAVAKAAQAKAEALNKE